MKNDQATQLRQLIEAKKKSAVAQSQKSARSISTSRKSHLDKNKSQPLESSLNGLKTIAITGGKGGVGKTNMSANLAVSMAQLGFRVGILDADLGLANIDVLFRLTPKYNLRHVLTGEKRIDDIILPGPLGISIIPGSSGIQALADLPAGMRQILIQELGRLEELIDYLIIDTPAGIGDNVLSFVLSADLILAVTEPDPMAYTDAYALIKTISRRKLNQTIYLVVNKVRSMAQGQEVYETLQTVSQRYQLSIRGINYMGYIPYEAKIRNALFLGSQKPFVLEHPNTRGAKCFQNLAKKLLYHLRRVSRGKIERDTQDFFSQVLTNNSD